MDNEYAKFFFNRKVDVYQLECIEEPVNYFV